MMQINFNKLRKTYCQCPQCNSVYRLSDSDISEDEKSFPKLDVLDKIDKELRELERKEAALKAKLANVKEQATIAGRTDADNHIAAIDTLFNPLGLNPNDAKVHFHPVDFIVFNGMNDIQNPKIKNIVLLDSSKNEGLIQESIRKCVENEQYEFITIKIRDDGSIVKE